MAATPPDAETLLQDIQRDRPLAITSAPTLESLPHESTAQIETF